VKRYQAWSRFNDPLMTPAVINANRLPSGTAAKFALLFAIVLALVFWHALRFAPNHLVSRGAESEVGLILASVALVALIIVAALIYVAHPFYQRKAFGATTPLEPWNAAAQMIMELAAQMRFRLRESWSMMMFATPTPSFTEGRAPERSQLAAGCSYSMPKPLLTSRRASHIELAHIKNADLDTAFYARGLVFSAMLAG
jgi:hypothetical protein